MRAVLIALLFSLNAKASTLVLIGGGSRPPEALKAFVSKTKPGPITVLAWGTDYPKETFQTIKEELLKAGAEEVICFCDETFTVADREMLSKSGGIYFPGGNQNKIMTRITRFDVKKLSTDLYHSGIPVAGTSAGTAIQTDPMLSGDGSNTTAGLGLLPNHIVDQHFMVRNREPRLLEALARFPELNGIGIDEGMSAVIEDSMYVTAIGPSMLIYYQSIDGKIKKSQFTDNQHFEIILSIRN